VRILAAVLTMAFWITAAASPALGHAILVRSEPGDGLELQAAPQLVRLWFSEPVTIGADGFELVDAGGNRVALGAATPTDARHTAWAATLPELRPDVYRVAWRVRSGADLHVTSGTLVFGVLRATDGRSTVAESVPAAPTLGEVATGWAGFVIDGLLAGALVLMLIVPTSAIRLRRRLVRLAIAAAALGASALALADLVVRVPATEWETVVTPTGYGFSWSLRELFLAGGLALLAAALRWPARSRAFAAIAVALTSALAAVTSLEGHAAATGDAIAIAAGAAHRFAATRRISSRYGRSPGSGRSPRARS
jgi:methionine-rich copper-binding protein CopC